MKPKPRIGMAVIWEDPTRLIEGGNISTLQMAHREYGEGPFRINSIIEHKTANKDVEKWIVTITKNGEMILSNDSDFAEPSKPEKYNWELLQPIPRPKLKTGTAVIWEDPSKIDRPDKDWGAKEIIMLLVKDYGIGPFVVEIQEEELVQLVNLKGIPLMMGASSNRRMIHRNFLQAL